MNLERMQRDAAELQVFLIKAVDAQLLAIAAAESLADSHRFAEAVGDLGRASLISWTALDEAIAIRGVYERAALTDELEVMGRARSSDLLHRWRDAMRRAERPFSELVSRWESVEEPA